MKKVTVVNYKTGNVYNVIRAFQAIGCDAILSNDPSEIEKADLLVLPGVGAFGYCKKQLESNGLVNSILEFSKKERPLLGICVGMQLFLEKSVEFGENEGLSLIEGNVSPIKELYETPVKTPIYGWYKLDVSNENLQEIQGQYYYFVHSFAVCPLNKKNIFANYSLEGVKIPAIIGDENILGVQFHPEKSGKEGLNFLKSFVSGKFSDKKI